MPHTENGKGLAYDTISALGQTVRGDIRYYFRPRADCPGGHPALGQNAWRDNLFTTAGPLTVSLGLSLATYCGITDDGMMTATLAAPRDLMIRFLGR